MEPYKRELVYYLVLLSWGMQLLDGDGVVHALAHGFGMGVLALLVVLFASIGYETVVPGRHRLAASDWRKIARAAAVAAVPANLVLYVVALTVPQVTFYAAFLLVTAAWYGGVSLPAALARPRIAPAWLTG